MLFQPILERSQDVDADLQIMLAGSMYLRADLHCCPFVGAALAMLRQTHQGIAGEVVHLRLLRTGPLLIPN